MNVAALGISIPIIALIGAVITIIYLRKYQNAERMAMIEKGVGKDLLEGARSNQRAFGTLRVSMLLIGIGLGFLLGYFLDYHFYMQEVGYFSMLFLLGGLGLGAAYIVEERKMKKPD